MTARANVELLVIGADAAGLAAAACAARSGATAALAATGGEAPAAGSIDEPPNFVWRQLDLHTHDLRLEPAGAMTSVSAEGALMTHADPMRTGDVLKARDPQLEHVWPAFAIEMKRRAGREADGDNRMAPDDYLPANALLDDFFADERLKTHLVSAYAAPFGLAGDEAGSAGALTFAGASPRRRLSARALVEALTKAAQLAGVEMLGGRLQAVQRGEGKHWRAVMDNGREVRARRVMSSSALIGEAAGLHIASAGSPLVRRVGAEATIRIRYDKRPAAEALREPGLYFTAKSRAEIIAARDAMIDGRIENDPFLAFEIDGKEIVARAPFCPTRLREGDEEREWTGQDRQILGRRAASLIDRLTGGGLGAVREIEVAIGADASSGLRRRSFDIPAIPAPAPSLDPVGAAAALALEIVGDD